MKIYKYIWTAILAAALATSAGMAQTVLTNSYTNSFPNGGNTGLFSGGSVASWIEWYGLSFGNTAMQGDAAKDAGGDPTSGSLFCSLPFTSGGQQVQIFGTFDNGGSYDNSQVIPLNLITNMGFDIFMDPATPTNSSGNFGTIQMALVDPGFNNGGNDVGFTSITIPGSAAGHWVHVTDTNTVANALAMQVAGFTQACGIGLNMNSFNGGYPATTMNFWIDNVFVQTLSAPPPPPVPPTLAAPVKTVPGLNVFASTSGLNDRQEVELVASNGLSWVGHTGSGPVTYSFTITSFPKAPAFTAEAFLFLIPNPAGKESAADYNETNVAWLQVQSTATGGQGIFQYKVNDASDNQMLFDLNSYTNTPGSWPGTPALTSNGTNVWTEKGDLTNVQSATVLGTWTLKFTSDQNGTIIAPDGTTANFTIPAYYYTNFTETTGFSIYLGMQGNTASAQNQAVVFSNFSVQGVPSPYSETFAGETSLSSAWTNLYAARPAGVLIVPPTAPYWIGWTTPAIGFSLIDSGSLGASAVWKNVSTYTPIQMIGTNMQLIAASDLANANADFFRMIQRSFSKLLVLLPGQTNTPGVAPGYAGTVYLLQ